MEIIAIVAVLAIVLAVVLLASNVHLVAAASYAFSFNAPLPDQHLIQSPAMHVTAAASQSVPIMLKSPDGQTVRLEIVVTQALPSASASPAACPASNDEFGPAVRVPLDR